MPEQQMVYKIAETSLWGEAIQQRKPVITNDCDAPNPLRKGFPKGHVPIRRHMNIPLIDNGRIVLLAGVGNKEAEYNETDVQQLTLLMSAMWRIVQERRAERSLQESEDRFYQIFAQDDDALFIFRAGSLELIDANPAALTLFGLNREEFARVKPESFMEPEDFRKFTEAIAVNDASRGFIIDRVNCYAAGGATVTFSLRAKILSLKSESVIFCSLRDITEKISLEEELRATHAKLIHINKMTSLGMLVSSVAHEINNPNHCISINTSVLANIWRDVAPHLQKARETSGEFLLGGLPCREIEDLVPKLHTGIAESSRRISTIVKDMKDFVKPEKSNLKGVMEINRVIETSASILWHHIQKHTDNFRTSLQDNLPSIRGNGQQIEQVLINLIMNALQALPDKSSGVFVTTAWDQESDTVSIEVRDEGKGMGREVLERLTEPFFSTKLHEGGTGLGLYISDSIIKEHNGSLEFKSTLGRGTTATIRLPAAGGGTGREETID